MLSILKSAKSNFQPIFFQEIQITINVTQVGEGEKDYWDLLFLS